MSTEPTPPSAPKPSLPSANKPSLPPAAPNSKPTLPAAPKLALAGSAPKPAAPAPVRPVASSDPFVTETDPASDAPAIARPPTIGGGAQAAVGLSASRAPASAVRPASVTKIMTAAAPSDEDAPKWAGALAGLGMVASLAGAVLLFLELKPTL